MEKSIDNIWKDGFINPDSLVIPKINKLYNTKTISTVNELKNSFTQNVWIVLGVTLMHAIGALIFTNVYISLFWVALFTPVMLLAKKQLDAMNSIDQTENSYTYIKAFNDWFQNCLGSFTNLYRVVYPLYVIGLATSAYFVSFDNAQTLGEIIVESQKHVVILGIPILWMGAFFIAVVAGLTSFFVPQIYQADIRSLYGGLMDRLALLVEEMEELRK